MTTATDHNMDNTSSTSIAPPPNVLRARARKLTLLVMLGSFCATTLLQNITQSRHNVLVKNTGAEANISNLNSFSLALLLGGLRGPLVMMLWMSSESQKQDKDLDDFDSKIEMIRLLQPEFDSVHLFQMWNKAYNVSVQMANKSNKYVTILDGIEYGEQTAEQKKDNVNILSEINKMYFSKLGASQEKGYYVDRARHETLPDLKVTVPQDRMNDFELAMAKANVDPARSQVLIARARKNGSVVINKLVYDVLKSQFTGPGIEYSAAETSPYLNGKRVRLNTLVDIDGKILPKYLAPVDERFATDPISGEKADGSTLQFLKQLEPFPYGVPPMAIGWNYGKRSQILRWAHNQKHIQISDMVIDNQPAVNLKWWTEAEWETGRLKELQAFDIKLRTARDVEAGRAAIELPCASLPLTTAIKDIQALKQAIYQYDLISKLAELTIIEFDRHQKRFANSELQFVGYRDVVKCASLISLADRDYLMAMMVTQNIPTDGIVFGGSGVKSNGIASTATPAEILKDDLPALKKRVIAEYQKASTAWELVMLKHHLNPMVAQNIFPKGINQTNIGQAGPNALTPDQIHGITMMAVQVLEQNPHLDTEADRPEAVRSLKRIFQRLMILDPEHYGQLLK